jgi:hypothetical protein
MKADPEYQFDKYPDGGVNRTAKACVPMLDAMQAGYLVTTPCDLYVNDGEFSWGNFPIPPVDGTHTERQYASMPLDGMKVKTFLNPFGISTPAGYSTMFKAPAGRFEPFQVFEGVVDTDKYHHPVWLPFTVARAFTGTIPVGTPIAQIVPFRREKWKAETVEDDTQHHFKDLFRTIAAYRKKAWSKKEYR